MSPHSMIWQLHCLFVMQALRYTVAYVQNSKQACRKTVAAQLCTGSCEYVQSWQGILSFHDVGKAWAVCKAIYIRVSWCTCKSLVLGAQVSQHGVPQAQLLGCATHTLLCPNPTPHYPLLHTLVHVTSSHTQNRYDFIIGALRRHWPACCCLAWCMLQVSRQEGPTLCVGSPSNAAPSRMVQWVSSLPQQEAEHA